MTLNVQVETGKTSGRGGGKWYNVNVTERDTKGDIIHVDRMKQGELNKLLDGKTWMARIVTFMNYGYVSRPRTHRNRRNTKCKMQKTKYKNTVFLVCEPT